MILGNFAENDDNRRDSSRNGDLWSMLLDASHDPFNMEGQTRPDAARGQIMRQSTREPPTEPQTQHRGS
jgi:hypothetical protein